MGLSYSSHSEGKLDESDLMNTNTDSTHLESSQRCLEPLPTAEQSRGGRLKRELCWCCRGRLAAKDMLGCITIPRRRARVRVFGKVIAKSSH